MPSYEKKESPPLFKCTEVLGLCRAMCCKLGGGVALTPDEIRSGKYLMEYLCIEKKEQCTKDIECYHKIVQLKTENGICVYLGDDDHCTIYEDRPRMCRNYLCSTGHWNDWKKDVRNYVDRELLRLNPELVFTHNPVRRLSAAFLVPDEKRIFLLVNDRSLCDDVMYGGEFEWPAAAASDVEAVYKSFDGLKTLGDIERGIADRMGAGSVEGFRRLVLLLTGQHLLINLMR